MLREEEYRELEKGYSLRVHWLEMWAGITGLGAAVVVGPVGKIVSVPETVLIEY